MNNFTRAAIVMSTALLVKILLNYFDPLSLKSTEDTSTEDVLSVKTFKKDIFENVKSDKIYLGFFGRLFDFWEGLNNF